jgi:hypothetical protein
MRQGAPNQPQRIVASSDGYAEALPQRERPHSKSFLVLFFKKEPLATCL